MSTAKELNGIRKDNRQKALGWVRKHDASNFDDYLVVGLVTGVTVALFAALILL